MAYVFEVRQLVPQPVASIVIPAIRRAAVGAMVGGALPDVFSHLTLNGVAMVAPPFARFHQGEVDGIFDLEAGIPVGSPFPETDTIKRRTLPGGEAISTLHRGSHDRIPEALAALARWILEHGRVAGGPSWEIYFDDPADSSVVDARTEVVVPLVAVVS